MSEIRNRIVKLLEESKISFMEDIEAQPDLFGGEDTYYKDGREAVGFMDVLDFMSEIAPDLDYTGDKQTKDLYWMIYDPATSGVKIDSNKVAEIESKLAERFGDGVVTVKLANSQYAPEIKRIYVGFVDKADVEDTNESVDNVTEGSAGLLKKGQRVRIKDGSETYPGEEGVIVTRNYTALSKTPFYGIQLDSGRVCDELGDNLEPIDLEEGWKDNLKKGVATLGVAGALAGNAMAHDPMYDGATRPFDDTDMTVQQVQQLSDEDEKAVRLPNGMIKDQYGNEWTQEDWETLMRGEDPFEDNDYPPEIVDNED